MKRKISVSSISMVALLVISVMLCGCGGDKATAGSKTTNVPEPKELVIGKWTSGEASMEVRIQ